MFHMTERVNSGVESAGLCPDQDEKRLESGVDSFMTLVSSLSPFKDVLHGFHKLQFFWEECCF